MNDYRGQYMKSPLSEHDLRIVHAMPLFSSVSPDVLDGLLAACTVRKIRRQEILITPGKKQHQCYLVISGRMRVHLDSPESDPVTYIEQGEPVGELAIIDKATTSAHVVADEDSRLLVMGEETLWSLVRESHGAATTLLKVLTRRLRLANHVIAEKMLMERSLFHHGSIDTLTGLHNRSWLDTILPRQLRRCMISGKPFSLILLDIDGFATFNARHGNLCGDRALQVIARVLMDNVRPTEMAARFEGNRFLIILPDVELKPSRNAAERLRQKIMYADIVMPDGRKLPSVTASFGLAQARPGQTLEGVLTVADSAVKRAKLMGRNFVSD
jgi:diguanylate cyclase (GGDEF)-like protein